MGICHHGTGCRQRLPFPHPTTAVLDGDEYRINGSKVMIGNGSEGDFILIFCLTDPDEKKEIETAQHYRG